MKRIVIEIIHAPYQTDNRARVGLELAMGLSAFDHQVSVLLTGQSIKNLQDIPDAPQEAYHKTFLALALYDVALWVNKTEISKAGLADLPSEVKVLSDQDIAAMKQQADIILSP